MAGHECRIAREIEAFGLQHAERRDADGHQRGLSIGGEHEGFVRSLEHDLRKLFAERIVDFREDFSRSRVVFGERLAHADGLRALSGKYECCRHCAVCCFLTRGPRRTGAGAKSRWSVVKQVKEHASRDHEYAGYADGL